MNNSIYKNSWRDHMFGINRTDLDKMIGLNDSARCRHTHDRAKISRRLVVELWGVSRAELVDSEPETGGAAQLVCRAVERRVGRIEFDSARDDLRSFAPNLAYFGEQSLFESRVDSRKVSLCHDGPRDAVRGPL